MQVMPRRGKTQLARRALPGSEPGLGGAGPRQLHADGAARHALQLPPPPHLLALYDVLEGNACAPLESRTSQEVEGPDLNRNLSARLPRGLLQADEVAWRGH